MAKHAGTKRTNAEANRQDFSPQRGQQVRLNARGTGSLHHLKQLETRIVSAAENPCPLLNDKTLAAQPHEILVSPTDAQIDPIDLRIPDSRLTPEDALEVCNLLADACTEPIAADTADCDLSGEDALKVLNLLQVESSPASDVKQLKDLGYSTDQINKISVWKHPTVIQHHHALLANGYNCADISNLMYLNKAQLLPFLVHNDKELKKILPHPFPECFVKRLRSRGGGLGSLTALLARAKEWSAKPLQLSCSTALGVAIMGGADALLLLCDLRDKLTSEPYSIKPYQLAITANKSRPCERLRAVEELLPELTLTKGEHTLTPDEVMYMVNHGGRKALEDHLAKVRHRQRGSDKTA